MNLILPKRFGQDKPPVSSQINRGHPLAQGLVGCWLFNEGAGRRVHDLSGRGNHGTLIDIATPPTPDSGWNPGRVGIGLKFDGVNDYIDCGDNLEWPGALSVSSWYKRNYKDTVNADGIIGNWYFIANSQLRRGWLLRYYINTDLLVFIIELTNGSSIQERQISYTTNVGEWYHAVAVFNPSDRSIKLYVNGILRSSTTVSADYNQIVHDSPYPMRIGYNPVNGGYFPGLIDEVCIYNRALSASEVSWLFCEPYAMF